MQKRSSPSSSPHTSSPFALAFGSRWPAPPSSSSTESSFGSHFFLSTTNSTTTSTMAPALPGSVLLAPSPAGTKYDMMYYLKGAAAGGICCSITHGALCPVDVVKTRVQLDPVKVCFWTVLMLCDDVYLTVSGQSVIGDGSILWRECKCYVQFKQQCPQPLKRVITRQDVWRSK